MAAGENLRTRVHTQRFALAVFSIGVESSDRFSDDNLIAHRSRDQAGRHFELRNHDALVRSLDPRRTSTSQLGGTQAGQHHELERWTIQAADGP
mgnify:CR=1 FL=1